MMTVTTQAPSAGKRPTAASQKVQEHIKRLTFDLVHHSGRHTLAEVFDPDCAECIYWAMKIVQNPDLWNESYSARQAGHLRMVPREVANHAVKTINDRGYSLKVRAREMDAQEYLQVVAGQ